MLGCRQQVRSPSGLQQRLPHAHIKPVKCTHHASWRSWWLFHTHAAAIWHCWSWSCPGGRPNKHSLLGIRGHRLSTNRPSAALLHTEQTHRGFSAAADMTIVTSKGRRGKQLCVILSDWGPKLSIEGHDNYKQWFEWPASLWSEVHFFSSTWATSEVTLNFSMTLAVFNHFPNGKMWFRISFAPDIHQSTFLLI